MRPEAGVQKSELWDNPKTSQSLGSGGHRQRGAVSTVVALARGFLGPYCAGGSECKHSSMD